MSEANTSAAENWTNKQDSIAVAHQESAQCYFRPETEELVFIADCHTDEFEHHWRDMMISMDEFHQANANYSRVLERYAQAAIADALAAVETRVVDEAEIEREKKREALKKKLGDLSQKGMSYDEVVELIPILGQGKKAKGGSKPTRYAYVKKSYFSQSQKGKKIHTVSLKGSDTKGGANSIYGKDKNGNTRIYSQKLNEQLKKLQSPKIKLDLNQALKWLGSDFDPDTLNEDFVLFDWAESWNNSLLYQEEFGANIDVSHGAQFMRFVSNVGVNTEFDPDKEQSAIKGEYKASLTMASGFSNITLYAPDRIGWSLAIKTSEGKAFNLGMLRLCVEDQLSGFVGASAQVEAQLQVVVSGDKQMLAGQSGGRLPRFRERRATGLEFHQAMEAKDEGLQLSGEAFAGIRIEGSLKGSVQWLKPSPPLGESGAPLPAILKSSGKFTNFCTFGGSIAGLLGAGAGGKLRCTFINGKFCFQIAASLCWGAGAKGSILAEVDAATIVEFGGWLVYQLYSLDYSFFEVVDEDAFRVYSQYCVMQINEIGENIYKGYHKVVNTPKDVAGKFEGFLNAIVEESKSGLEGSKGRNRLARNIIEFQRDLLLHTPEAKGILLYLLTRHGKSDHLDPENRTLLGDIYPDRKEAIVCVLRSIQTIEEWNKVMCRITTDGSSLAGESSETEVVKDQVEHLVRFLQEGHNRDEDLLKTYKRLKKTIAWGHALDMNDTVYYQLNTQPNHHYPQRCMFGPCEAESNQFV